MPSELQVNSFQPPPPPPPQNASLDVADIWDTLRRGKWVILLTCLLFAGAAGLYTYTIPPTYEALSIVSLSGGGGPVPGIDMNPVSRPPVEAELGLLRNSVELSRRVGSRLQANADALGSTKYFPALQPGDDGTDPTLSEVARRIRENMAFESYQTESQILIRARSTSPEEAALVANIYAAEYQKLSQERSRANLVAVREFVEEQVKHWEQQLNNLDSQWEQLSRSRSFLTEGEAGQQVAAEYTSLVRRVEAARIEIENQRIQQDLLREQLSNIEPDLLEDISSDLSAQIAALDAQIGRLRAEAEAFYNVNPSLRGQTSEELPDDLDELREILRQLENYEARRRVLHQQRIEQTLGSDDIPASNSLEYAAQLKTRILEINTRIRELQGEIDVLQGSIDEYAARLDQVPRQIVETQQLEIRRSMTRERYISYVNTLQDIEIAEQAEQGFVEIFYEARVPDAPVAPDLPGNVMLSALVGLILGTGLVFLRASLHTRLQDPDDLEKLGYDIAGVIPSMDREIKSSFQGRNKIEVEGRMLSTQLVTLLNPWSPIAENYRMVRTNLQLGQKQAPPQVMLVTSPEMSDGKTVNCVNLAIAMTQSGHRTLLIDADLRRPSIHKMLDLRQTPGLAELLMSLNGEAPQMDRFATTIHNLYVVPAGDTVSPPPELLGSARMKHLMNYFRQSFDTIIIDSPPVLAATDALVMASLSDASLVVISADRTNTQVLDAACARLTNVGSPIAGIIFNRFDTKKAGRSGYTYSYSHKYYVHNNGAA